MKYDKACKLIFGEIIKPKEHMMKMDIDDKKIFITPNGYFGFVFNKKSVPFNLEQILQSKIKLDFQSVVIPENLCKLTKNLVITEIREYLNIFKCGTRKVYVNQKYLKYFEEYTEFYQKGENNIMVAVEYGQIVGAVMPLRYLEGEDDV